jgi:hypothetical protein
VHWDRRKSQTSEMHDCRGIPFPALSLFTLVINATGFFLAGQVIRMKFCWCARSPSGELLSYFANVCGLRVRYHLPHGIGLRTDGLEGHGCCWCALDSSVLAEWLF